MILTRCQLLDLLFQFVIGHAYLTSILVLRIHPLLDGDDQRGFLIQLCFTLQTVVLIDPVGNTRQTM